MHDNIRNLLNAYLDGELHGTRLLEVKMHLASCETCREELKTLRQVLNLLHDTPTPAFLPVERFVANLTLNLPRRTLADRPPKPGSPVWWLVPAVLMAAWFFAKTVFTLTSVVTAANTAGLLENVSWLNSEQQWLWISMAQTVFGIETETHPLLSTLNEVSVFGINWFNGFLWQAAIVLLYWGWLTVWWIRRRPRPLPVTLHR
jgi:hypothetical protein